MTRKENVNYVYKKLNESEQTIFRKFLVIAAVISTYWVVSISLVFVNKYLLSSEDQKLDAPLFITWFQCVVTVLVCVLLRGASLIIPEVFAFPTISIELDIVRQTLPLSFVFVGMVVFNNLCLKYVGVAFYFIGRSLTTVFNVVLSYIILGQKTSLKAVICCLLIVFGFMLGVDQENVTGSLSIKGVICGIMASMCVAIYAIYIKKILPKVGGDVMVLTFYNNINACGLFLPLMIAFGEHNEVAHSIWDLKFTILMVTGGVFGLAIGYLTSLQVKVTSPLTNNISGTAKACVQTVMACLWYHETKSALWWISNFVILLGSAAYTRVRQVEMVREHVQKHELVKHVSGTKSGNR